MTSRDKRVSEYGASREQRHRYLTDPMYHAKVCVVARWLEDWDFTKGAREDRDFYLDHAMQVVDLVEAVPLADSDGVTREVKWALRAP